uniref:Arylacetamide deacetylase-like 4 isoform X2 n=1 Tax=Castor canadensis TaxID=51338 RepID=A0A8B7U8G7_CASCN|nr:arylacetamide deacetylase-like 4 isoform X2 [Castor canadensis]
MVIFWLVLLGGLPTFSLGLLVWVVGHHLLTAEIPSAFSHKVKFRFLHCMLLYVIALGNILEKLKIASMPGFVQFLHDLLPIKKDPKVLVTNLRFGTIPVRLFQPKAASPRLHRDCYHSLCSFLARETDSVLLSVGYRKLPDYHFPVASYDCLNASIHFLKTLETYGVDPSRVVLCGESIGGGAVANVIQALVGRQDLPQIRAQVLIYPIVQVINFQLPSVRQNQNIPFLNRDFMMTCVCKYLSIDLSWKDAMLKGTCISEDAWEKYRKWLSSDNIPKRFRSKDHEPEFPGPFNEAAYLETKHTLDVGNSPLIADDEVIARLPEAFVVSCEGDTLRDDALLYKKRLEDHGIPVTWYHVEDGFHGCIIFFDKKLFSFPCSKNIMNAIVRYIKDI